MIIDNYSSVRASCSYLYRCTFCDPAGSPWRVDVRSPASITVTGNGLHLVPVGRVAVFEVHSSQSNGDVIVNITCKLMSFSVRLVSVSVSFR
jgi:hypothetical protein